MSLRCTVHVAALVINTLLLFLLLFSLPLQSTLVLSEPHVYFSRNTHAHGVHIKVSSRWRVWGVHKFDRERRRGGPVQWSVFDEIRQNHVTSWPKRVLRWWLMTDLIFVVVVVAVVQRTLFFLSAISVHFLHVFFFCEHFL